MRTHIQKCPGGVAVFVPETIAARAGLTADGPAAPSTLAELLTGITPDNLHSEWAAGPPVGAELL